MEDLPNVEVKKRGRRPLSEKQKENLKRGREIKAAQRLKEKLSASNNKHQIDHNDSPIVDSVAVLDSVVEQQGFSGKSLENKTTHDAKNIQDNTEKLSAGLSQSFVSSNDVSSVKDRKKKKMILLDLSDDDFDLKDIEIVRSRISKHYPTQFDYQQPQAQAQAQQYQPQAQQPQAQAQAQQPQAQAQAQQYQPQQFQAQQSQSHNDLSERKRMMMLRMFGSHAMRLLESK